VAGSSKTEKPTYEPEIPSSHTQDLNHPARLWAKVVIARLVQFSVASIKTLRRLKAIKPREDVHNIWLFF